MSTVIIKWGEAVNSDWPCYKKNKKQFYPNAKLVTMSKSAEAIEKLFSAIQLLFDEKKSNPYNKKTRLQNAWNYLAIAFDDAKKAVAASQPEGREENADIAWRKGKEMFGDDFIGEFATTWCNGYCAALRDFDPLPPSKEQPAGVGKEDGFYKMFEEFVAFSLPTFKDATASTSIEKLKDEAQELQYALADGFNKPEFEYADCIMCLLDSAARAGVSVNVLYDAFKIKLHENKNRQWKRNDNGTYSHVK